MPAYLLRALELLALERQQRLVLIQPSQTRPISIEGVVIVISEGLRQHTVLPIGQFLAQVGSESKARRTRDRLEYSQALDRDCRAITPWQLGQGQPCYRVLQGDGFKDSNCKGVL